MYFNVEEYDKTASKTGFYLKFDLCLSVHLQFSKLLGALLWSWVLHDNFCWSMRRSDHSLLQRSNSIFEKHRSMSITWDVVTLVMALTAKIFIIWIRGIANVSKLWNGRRSKRETNTEVSSSRVSFEFWYYWPTYFIIRCLFTVRCPNFHTSNFECEIMSTNSELVDQLIKFRGRWCHFDLFGCSCIQDLIDKTSNNFLTWQSSLWTLKI